jgi:hypothetical protein
MRVQRVVRGASPVGLSLGLGALVLSLYAAAPAGGTGIAGGRGSALAAPPPAIVQPPPPVTSSAFPQEPTGVAPVDGDGLIPNPATPTGAAIGPPARCSVSFLSAEGTTSSTVNAWIARNENSIKAPTVVCLAGTFDDPLHVWSKSSVPLLEIAPQPGATATLDLGQAKAADIDPNQYWSDSGGVSIVDSRSVEVYGLTIENYTTDGKAFTPAGIYLTVRSDTTSTDQSRVPHESACFLHGGACSDIYVLDNTVEDITNTADEDQADKSLCNSQQVDAYGIAVIAAGSATSPALQHVVVEGNTVTGTRTGQSETVTFNGDLTDFLVAGNDVHDVDNIGMDTIGWEVGSSQANHGLIYDNTVYNVDTYDNAAYGHWTGTTCAPIEENAAGIYDDGAAYIWIDDNVVWNTDQGINLDVETRGKYTDHLLVSGNDVQDGPGTSTGDPSGGANPPGTSGSSTVVGHDPYAFYVDAFGGGGASIYDVYAHDNTFWNESQYFLSPREGMPAVDLGGIWYDVEIWHNTIRGEGAGDRYNPLFEVDRQPAEGTEVVDCNDYGDLSTSAQTVNGNFALPGNSWLSLADWQHDNGHGWDADSAVGGFDPSCPKTSIS